MPLFCTITIMRTWITENVEQENHTNLAILTWELDDLCHRVQAGEGQPAEVPHWIECELQRLSIAHCPSAP